MSETARASVTARPSVPQTDAGEEYLYVTRNLQAVGLLCGLTLAQTTERHPADLVIPPLKPAPDVMAELRQSCTAGTVLEMAGGLPSEQQLQIVADTLRAGRRSWLWWPSEQAIECVDAERLRALRRHLAALTWTKRLGEPIDRMLTRWHRVPAALRWIYRGEFPVRRMEISTRLDRLAVSAQPVSLDVTAAASAANAGAGGALLPGVGLYFRADYWTTSAEKQGGDRGVPRVARELAGVTHRVVCLLPWAEPALNESSVSQIVMDRPRQTAGEDGLILAPAHYWPIVKASCQALSPTYLYERLCAGQSVGAELSQLLRIPYIVEYHGSGEILREAINGNVPFYSELYAKAEELALRQATVIVVASQRLKDDLVSHGIDARRVMLDTGEAGMGRRLAAFAGLRVGGNETAASIQTGDKYKDRVQTQWNSNPVGSHYARRSQPHTLDWFIEVERHRYREYAPWMPQMMEFADHGGQAVLEIGGGLGTDLAQFAAHGALVTDVDLSAGHLQLAQENFRLRGLNGQFIHHDAEMLPFDDGCFDLVYSNGVLHHTPNTGLVVGEIYRVLRPGGRAIVMVYAENSLHYWRNLFWTIGVKQGSLDRISMGEIMSRSVERSANEAKPLVKVYTRPRLRALFRNFARVEIAQRQLVPEELPRLLKWSAPFAQRLLGWNLIIKGVKA